MFVIEALVLGGAAVIVSSIRLARYLVELDERETRPPEMAQEVDTKRQLLERRRAECVKASREAMYSDERDAAFKEVGRIDKQLYELVESR